MNKNWFTIEEIDSQTHAISEYGHWEKVHSYLIQGEEHALLVDTGLGVGDIRVEVEALTDLPVLVVTTHVHWDHIGGHGSFDEIAVHEGDRDWLENGLPLPDSVVRKQLNPDKFTQEAPSGFNVEQVSMFRGEPAMILEDEMTLSLGDRDLEVFHTPGHSPGHICLHEAETGYLFTGDLLYAGTLYVFYDSTDPSAYAASIRRLTGLSPLHRILPGHNSLDIPVGLLREADTAFEKLAHEGKLHHGAGTFDFGTFSIKL